MDLLCKIPLVLLLKRGDFVYNDGIKILDKRVLLWYDISVRPISSGGRALDF